MFELIFITSSREKLAHARYLCRNRSIKISKQKNYGIGYEEPKIHDRAQLIEDSVNDAIKRFKQTVSNYENKLFFIEDTSVIVDALSDDIEVPGVDVKYWMMETTFSSLDEELKALGNNRRVTVRSDVVLVLNKELKEKYKMSYMIFTSTTEGSITEKEHRFKPNPLYPWLNNRTFNKWFVPFGAKKPLACLDINQATKYDFRIGAFEKMLNFLEENHILKIGAERYTQVKLSELIEPLAFIVCGFSCAGKTTIAKYLVEKYNYFHVEASDFMHLSYYENHGTNSSVPIGDFAERALKESYSIVVDQIINALRGFKYLPLIVTGFRSPKEIHSFINQYGGGLNVIPLFIDADLDVRFERSKLRGRKDSQKTLNDFIFKDKQQESMGLLHIKDEYQDSIIINNSSQFEEYFNCFEQKFEQQLIMTVEGKKVKVPKRLLSKKLQNAIIMALDSVDDKNAFYTTTEISHLTENMNVIDLRKNKNNISRFFNQNYHHFFEIHNENGKLSYRLSQTGESYAKWLSKQQM